MFYQSVQTSINSILRSRARKRHNTDFIKHPISDRNDKVNKFQSMRVNKPSRRAPGPSIKEAITH